LPAKTALARGILEGDARSLARAISLVENETPEGIDLVGEIFEHTGHAYLIGVTGAPGAGKSTLVDRLTAQLRTEGKTVGVIAVDPTSPFSGGAVLGDRVRMGRHVADEGVFIRSMATRGQLGGLARATTDTALVLDAAGKDVVIIETVGVGQDEVDIAKTADVCVVMLVPGTGDEVQALKAGIMEIADIFVVNKADREGTDRLVQSVAANLTLQRFDSSDWRPPILKTVATTGEGIPELWASISAFRTHSADTGQTRARARTAYRLRELLANQFMERLKGTVSSGEWDTVVERIAARELDLYTAATELMNRVLANPESPESPESRIPDPESR
jgi:LAO/AO transport system kinase